MGTLPLHPPGGGLDGCVGVVARVLRTTRQSKKPRIRSQSDNGAVTGARVNR
jgi:hypothetical protein